MKKALSLILALALCAGLAVPALAADVQLSAQKLDVDNIPIECEKYNIDGSNYFKLRDIAYLVNGTGSQFDVGWDAPTQTVTVTTGRFYTPDGSELVASGDHSASAQPSKQRLLIDGVEHAEIAAYNINGNNYFKLRDLGAVLDFYVFYFSDTNTATINTTLTDYTELDDEVREAHQNARTAFNRGAFEAAYIEFATAYTELDDEVREAYEAYEAYQNEPSAFNREVFKEFYFELATAEELESIGWAAWCLYKGVGTSQNYESAADLYSLAGYMAEHTPEYAVIQNNLGWLYYEGRGVEQNDEKAVEFFSRAADMGLAAAQNVLGLCYYSGRGIAQDYRQAAEWFQEAAKQGLASAQYNLGVCYYYGRGVKRDYAQAAEWFRKSADQGYENAEEYYQAALEKINEAENGSGGQKPISGQEFLDALYGLFGGGSGSGSGGGSGQLSEAQIRQINQNVVTTLATNWKNDYNKNHPGNQIWSTNAKTLFPSITYYGSTATVKTQVEYWYAGKGGSASGSVYATVMIDTNTGKVISSSIG